ncbi:hypothetical protein AAAC51_04125 [Priestia megaterium]
MERDQARNSTRNEEKPQASDLYCYLAVCLAKQIEESIIFEKMVLNLEMDRALHQALTLNPSSSLAHFVRGIKYRETPLMFGGITKNRCLTCNGHKLLVLKGLCCRSNSQKPIFN